MSRPPRFTRLCSTKAVITARCVRSIGCWRARIKPENDAANANIRSIPSRSCWRLSPIRCGVGISPNSTNCRQNTHNTESQLRVLLYPWHPWHGRSALTCKGTARGADQTYLCRLEDTPPEAARVEIPRWMFDAASCSRMHLETSPQVDCETFRELKQLLQAQRAVWAAPMVQPQLSWQPGRGEADDTDHGPNSGQATGVVCKKTPSPALG